MKIELDVNRWLDPGDSYAVEMLAPKSPLLPIVKSIEEVTLLSLVEYMRSRHGEDSLAVARLLEAISETCGTATYRALIQQLIDREPVVDLLRSMQAEFADCMGDGDDPQEAA